jgi:hypothetical protein
VPDGTGSSEKEKDMKLRVVLDVEVDDEAWKREYGLADDELRVDVVGHLPEALYEDAKARARLLGTFRVAGTRYEVL